MGFKKKKKKKIFILNHKKKSTLKCMYKHAHSIKKKIINLREIKIKNCPR